MAAKTVQLGSFCGGSSKLVDSTFMGMEESVNMYPETVEATDTYSRKMLKSIEGFKTAFKNENIVIVKLYYASTSPFGEPRLYAICEDGVYRMDYFGSGSLSASKIAEYKVENITDVVLVGNYVSVCETSGANPYLVICGSFRIQGYSYDRLIFCIPLNSEPEEGEDLHVSAISLPNAFDHSGKIKPLNIAYLNYRLIVDDEGHDYIYWSELNKPDGADDDKAFYQKLTRYTYTKNDGTHVTSADNQYYAPAYGTYVEGTLQTTEVWMAALNNVKVDFKADNITGIVALDKSLVVLGENSFQIFKWQDSVYCPFITSAKTSSVGLCDCAAMSVIENNIYFLGQGSVGENKIWKLGETGIEKVSTIAVEQRLSKVRRDSEVKSFSYMHEGHTFFVISFKDEGSNFTICYDVNEGVWHDRASLDSQGNLNFWKVFDSELAYKRAYFISESKNSIIYFDSSSFVDAEGRPIPRIRTTGIKFDGGNDIIAHTLELVTDNGATKDFELNPRVMLQVSFDGGYTWSNEKWAKSGMMGKYNYRTIFEGLGAGAKLAFRVKMTDHAPFNIATAMLTYTPCKNRIF